MDAEILSFSLCHGLMALLPLGNCTKYGAQSYNEETGVCICHAGHRGALCDEVVWAYFASMYVTHALASAAIVFVLIWAAIIAISWRLENKYQRKSRRLAMSSLVLNILACLVRLAFLWMPTIDNTPFYPKDNVVLNVVLIITNNLPPVAWLSGCALVMAFWMHGLTHRLNTKTLLARRTTILLIVSSVLLLVSTLIGVGCIVFTEELEIVGVALSLVPLVAVIVVQLVLAIIIRRFAVQNYNAQIRRSHQWASSLLITAVVIWLVYLVAIFSLGFWLFNTTVTERWPVFFSHFGLRITESAIAIVLLLLNDVRAVRLRRFCHCPVDETFESAAMSTTQCDKSSITMNTTLGQESFTSDPTAPISLLPESRTRSVDSTTLTVAASSLRGTEEESANH